MCDFRCETLWSLPITGAPGPRRDERERERGGGGGGEGGRGRDKKMRLRTERVEVSLEGRRAAKGKRRAVRDLASHSRRQLNNAGRRKKATFLYDLTPLPCLFLPARHEFDPWGNCERGSLVALVTHIFPSRRSEKALFDLASKTRTRRETGSSLQQAWKKRSKC